MMRTSGSARPRSVVVLLIATTLLGCGRVGFDAGDGATGGVRDAATDATVDAAADTSVPASCDREDGEPNDEPGDADLVSLPATIDATLCRGDIDYYSADLLAGDELTVTLEYDGTGSYLWLELFEPDATTRAARAVPTEAGATAWTIAPPTAGRHYIRVRGLVSDAGTSYRIHIALEPGRHFFLSPGGSDSQPGTIELPWGTFGYALGQVSPGDTLVLMDGVYTEATTGRPDIDCSRGVASGTSGRPIRMVALRERRAHILGDGLVDTLVIDSCTNWIVEGLRIEGRDDEAARTDSDDPELADVRDSSQIVLRRLLLERANRFSDASLLLVGPNSREVLVEESEGYHFHRTGFSTWRSSQLTFRRNYQNSRGYPDLSIGDELWPSGMASRDGFSTDDPTRGGASIRVFASDDVIVENNVAEGNRYTQFTSSGTNSGARFYGSIELDTSYGFYSIPTGTSPRLFDLHVEDCVGIGGRYSGHWYRSTEGVVCQSCTSIGSAERGIRADRTGSPTVGVTSFTCLDCLSLSSRTFGFLVQDMTSWSVVNSVSFDNGSVAFPDVADPSMDVTQTDPLLGGCLVYLPADSPLRGAGMDGADVGANITHRHLDGGITTVPLWDPETGAFPCGATVEGVNDDPSTSCVGVHTRLAVGAVDCPLPYAHP